MKKMILIIVAILSLSLIIPTNTFAASFPDVSENHWAFDSIDKLSNTKIINGYNNGTFDPEGQVTRAQAAKILARALSLQLDSSYKTSYQDIPSAHWAFQEIRALTELGVFSNASKFNPDAPLSRAQMAKVLVVAYQIKIDDNHQITFSDVPKDNWHPYITTLAEVQISQGVTSNLYNPYGKVTRAQLAAFVHRSMIWDQKRDSNVIKYDEKNRIYIDSSLAAFDTAVETIHLVNIERAKVGLPTLTLDAPLSKISTLKSEDMVKNDYFSHTSPTYGAPWDMAEEFGYSYRSFGENIAFGQHTAKEVVTAWMNSSGHKANILNKDYTNIGAGIAKDANGRIYWTHMFSSH